MTDYLCLVAELPAEREGALSETLAGLPVLGAQLEPAAPGWLEVRVYLEPGSPAAEWVAAALEALGVRALHSLREVSRDWLAEYRTRVRAHAVGRLWWMDPHPDQPTPAPKARLRLVLEPRMAFGTGSHESTQLVLLALEALADRGVAAGTAATESLAGRRVLDVGTGSGVLALAADRLGAAWVVGLDVDPEAIWVARQTAGEQEWTAQPHYLIGPLSSLGPSRFDLVLCNMIPEQLVPLLPDLKRRLAADGRLLLSGLLEEQRGEVEGRLAEVGLQVVETRRLAEWAGLEAVVR
jgi:ribosomal protein L11 methyltransferase